MARPRFFACILVLLLGFSTLEAHTQSCYYPNGDITTVDYPCPNSDLCCPFQWQCLDNGLCYDPTANYLERRTCTDKSWESDDCPNFCTYSSAGNEAILHCESGKYCCDGNRVSFDCCDGTLPPGTNYFELPDGKLVGSITKTVVQASATSRSSPSSVGSSPSSSSSSTLTTDASRSAESSKTTTTESLPSFGQGSTASSTGSTGTSPDAQGTSASNSQADNSHPNDPSSSKSNSFGIGAIVGVAIGVSALVIICAIAIFFLHRRYKKCHQLTWPRPPSPPAPMEIKYSSALPPGTHAPEIDSSPKAATDSTSELYGSEVSYQRNSTVSSVTTGANGYSPSSVVTPVVANGRSSGPGPGRMSQIHEKDEPAAAELWGGHVYRPYRPGMEDQPGFGEAKAYQGT